MEEVWGQAESMSEDSEEQGSPCKLCDFRVCDWVYGQKHAGPGSSQALGAQPVVAAVFGRSLRKASAGQGSGAIHASLFLRTARHGESCNMLPAGCHTLRLPWEGAGTHSGPSLLNDELLTFLTLCLDPLPLDPSSSRDGTVAAPCTAIADCSHAGIK